MVSCPLFEGNLWESSQNHIDDFLSFCQSIGIYDIHTSAFFFHFPSVVKQETGLDV
jgi:hypothetical protein